MPQMQPKTLKVELYAKPQFKTDAKSVCKRLGFLTANSSVHAYFHKTTTVSG